VDEQSEPAGGSQGVKAASEAQEDADQQSTAGKRRSFGEHSYQNLHRPCPRCGSDRVHRSHRRGSLEHVLRLAGFKIRRCHACGLRFTRFGGSVIVISDLRRALLRIAQITLALVAAALVLAVVLWFSMRQASPPSSLNGQ